MHLNRNNGAWPELKGKRHDKFDYPKFDDAPLVDLGVKHSDLDKKAHDIQKIQKDRAAKQLSDVQSMFKDMADYDKTHNKRT
jgi:hypothetical protein